MSKLKKMVGFLLSLTMICSALLPAGAAGEGYTITITGDKTGHIYEAYQIFSGTLSSNENILSDIIWGSGIDSSAFLTALKEDTVLSTVFTNCATAADVAEKLAGYADKSTEAMAFAQIASEHLSTTVAGTSTEVESATYRLTGLTAGYYLVKDQDNSVTAAGDAYTDIILEVVGNVKVDVKAEYPTVTKTVSDVDASIGDTVTYTLKGTVPDTSAYTSYTYIFHDTLSTGLTFDKDSLNVKNGDTELKEGVNYTVDSKSNGDGSTSITVTMLNAKALSGATIVVTYDATLNDKAVVGQGSEDGTSVNGNPNTVYVEYSNNPNWVGDGEDDDEPTGNTPEDKVVTFTFELDVTKVDGSSYVDADEETGETEGYTKMLESASFVLYRTIAGGAKQYVTTDENSKVTGWTSDLDSASVLTSDANGTFSIIGLDAGTYYLEETAAPDGYNKLSSPITITITPTYKDTDGDGMYDVIDSLTATADKKDLTTSVSDGIVSAAVENKAGSTLPSTGGIGTTLFYVIGSIMILTAAVLLITRRRMRKI